MNTQNTQSCQKDLRLLSNSALHEQTKLKAKAERIATTELLNHIAEVQRRKLFADLGYESLYAFCVRDLMMSEGDAVRYKNAAFLMRDCPEIEEKIIEGSLCFTNVAHIAAHVNAENRAGFELSLEQRKVLVAEIESTSTRKAERILLSHAKRPIADVKESVRAVNETIAELKTPIDDEFAEIIDRLKQIWSHSMPRASIGEILKRAATVALHYEDPLEKAKRAVAKRKSREKKKRAVATTDARETKQNFVEEQRGASTTMNCGQIEKSSSLALENPAELQRGASTSLGFEKLITERVDESENKSFESSQSRKSELQEIAEPSLMRASELEKPLSRYTEKQVDHQLWLRDEGQCTHRVQTASGARQSTSCSEITSFHSRMVGRIRSRISRCDALSTISCERDRDLATKKSSGEVQ